MMTAVIQLVDLSECHDTDCLSAQLPCCLCHWYEHRQYVTTAGWVTTMTASEWLPRRDLLTKLISNYVYRVLSWWSLSSVSSCKRKLQFLNSVSENPDKRVRRHRDLNTSNFHGYPGWYPIGYPGFKFSSYIYPIYDWAVTKNTVVAVWSEVRRCYGCSCVLL